MRKELSADHHAQVEVFMQSQRRLYFSVLVRQDNVP